VRPELGAWIHKPRIAARREILSLRRSDSTQDPEYLLHGHWLKFASMTFQQISVKNSFMLKLQSSRDLHTITRNLPNKSATLSVLSFEHRWPAIRKNRRQSVLFGNEAAGQLPS
jgi:hypothetical protein